jgi:uncharacterized protein YdiU (UPF0061 family)
MLSFDHSFQTLPAVFYNEVQPTPLTNPKLIAISRDCEKLLQLGLTDDQLTQWLNGTLRLSGDQRISTRYAGHQFGVWAGQLGDGRAISLGEIIVNHERFEVQTKGSGLTPFSRMGDGKAVVRSSIREYLASEHMNALNVPTTRALACIAGDDPVEREQIERSALIARVFPSNLRFGHFEYAFHFDQPEALKALVEYARKNFFQECSSTFDMLQTISHRTASLIADWMGLGFCHGVMNTDNMSLLGLTIDYGPFGFMEDFDKNWICNHSDPQGRYNYSNQPNVALWNLDRLLWTFSELVPREQLQEIFDGFLPTYEKCFEIIFRKKLGLQKELPEDIALIAQLLQLMHQQSLDFTYIFRNLTQSLSAYPNLQTLPEWKLWQDRYQQRLLLENVSPEQIKVRIHKQNPKYVLKNYIAQEIIDSVETTKPSELLQKWFEVLTHPFDEHPDFHKYSLPTPSDKKDMIVSCSS